MKTRSRLQTCYSLLSGDGPVAAGDDRQVCGHPKGQNFRSPEAVTGQWQQMAEGVRREQSRPQGKDGACDTAAARWTISRSARMG